MQSLTYWKYTVILFANAVCGTTKPPIMFFNYSFGNALVTDTICYQAGMTIS